MSAHDQAAHEVDFDGPVPLSHPFYPDYYSLLKHKYERMPSLLKILQ